MQAKMTLRVRQAHGTNDLRLQDATQGGIVRRATVVYRAGGRDGVQYKRNCTGQQQAGCCPARHS